MIKKAILFSIILGSLLISCQETKQDSQAQSGIDISNPTNRVVLSSELNWEKLNPARGDKSPQAATIWGDRKGRVPTGFLAKFVDGFSSPPHIHNVTYRAMVVKGLIHNDDPQAEKMWMPTGSFWTQPAGESHITAAKGTANIAYVEIDQGPYLVKPIEEAFDNGERPINIAKTNLVWLGASESNIIKKSTSAAAVAYLWEAKQMSGKLLKLPANFEGNVLSTGDQFHAVVIEGILDYIMPDTNEHPSLDPGSYFTSTAKAIHALQVKETSEVIIYIRTNGGIRIE